MSKPFKVNILDLTRAIRNGDLDASLSSIGSALKCRREELTLAKRRSLTVGDTVYFTNTVKPSYLVGQAAKVTKINVKRIIVNLLNPIGRFDNGVRCPLSIIQMEKPE